MRLLELMILKSALALYLVNLNTEGEVRLLDCKDKKSSPKSLKNTKITSTSSTKKKFKGIHPGDYNLDIKKGTEKIYESGDCIFPFRVEEKVVN